MSFDELLQRIRGVHAELQREEDEDQWGRKNYAEKNPDKGPYEKLFDRPFAIAHTGGPSLCSEMQWKIVADKLVPIIAEAIRKDALPEILASAIRRYAESNAYSGKYKQLIALTDYLEDRGHHVYELAERPLDRLADAIAEEIAKVADPPLEVLDPEAERLLAALKKAGTTLTQYDLAERRSVNLSRKTIGQQLSKLRQLGMTHRPNGERKGDAITSKGLAALSRKKKNRGRTTTG